MIIFDTTTLLASVSTIQVAGASILAVLWVVLSLRNQDLATALMLWSAGLIGGAGASTLIASRGHIPDLWSIGASHLLLILAAGFCRAAVASSLGQQRRMWIPVAIAVVWILGYSYSPFFDNGATRTHFIFTYLAGMSGWIVWMAFFQNRECLYTVSLLGAVSSAATGGLLWAWGRYALMGRADTLVMFADRAAVLWPLALMIAVVAIIVLAVGITLESSVLRQKVQFRLDGLTGLPNRQGFLDSGCFWLSENGAAAKRYAVILFEIDQLGSINESFGHKMGNVVVQLFSRVVREETGETAITGRVDGKEFAVFLPGADAKSSFMIARKICRRFEAECDKASAGRLVASAGAGLTVSGAATPLERSLATAKRTLRKIKGQGPGRIMLAGAVKDKQSVKSKQLPPDSEKGLARSDKRSAA